MPTYPSAATAAERTAAMPSTTAPAASTFLGIQDAGVLKGWPRVADGHGGVILASPTGTSWHRLTSLVTSREAWDVVDAYYATDAYKVFRAEHQARRAAEREARLAEFRAEHAR